MYVSGYKMYNEVICDNNIINGEEGQRYTNRVYIIETVIQIKLLKF